MKREMVRLTMALAGALALLLIAAMTFAQPDAGPGARRGHGGPPSAESILQKLDANQDGKLTEDELPESVAERIMQADADGDGAVTKEELEQARPGRGGGPGGPGGPGGVEGLFAALDKNGDGVLTEDEVPEKLADKLAAADANGDGQVTKEELQQARPGRGGGPGGPGGPPSIDQVFERFDLNRDGKLTKDELPEPVAERIMKADADGDGAVTKEELEQARRKMGGRFIDKLFERFDANQDGKLTKEELPAQFAEKLMQADADGDGAVTKEELQAAREKLGPRPGATVLFRHFDKDGDGRLAASEVPQVAQERLLQADADGDGGVTPEEIRDAICARLA